MNSVCSFASASAPVHQRIEARPAPDWEQGAAQTLVEPFGAGEERGSRPCFTQAYWSSLATRLWKLHFH